MSQETPLSVKDPWVVRSVVVVAAILIVATILELTVFPLVQPNARASGLWDAICSAAGLVREPTSETPIEPDFKVSPAVMTSDMLRGPTPNLWDGARRSPSNERSVMAPRGESRRFSQSRGPRSGRDL